jgi:hypothetical protein
MALPVIAEESGRCSREQQRTQPRERHLDRSVQADSNPKDQAVQQAFAHANGYKPKFIEVQTLVEMKDVVEEEGEDEDEDESDLLRIQDAMQTQYATSGTMKRVLFATQWNSNRSSQQYHVGFLRLFLGLYRYNCSRD